MKIQVKMQLSFFGNDANNQIIKKADASAMLTGLNDVFLHKKATNKFFTTVRDAATFLPLITWMQEDQKKGFLTGMTVSEDNMRSAEELRRADPESLITSDFHDIPFELTHIVSHKKLSNDFIRFNAMKYDFIPLFMGQAAISNSMDIQNLLFLGDTARAVGDGRDNFLKSTNGLLKKLKDKLPTEAPNQLIDFSVNYASFSEGYFFDLEESVQSKYVNNKYRWICSSKTKQAFRRFLINRQTVVGDIILTGNSSQINPLDYPFEIVAGFPDDMILFADPKDLIMVYYKEMQMKSTDTGDRLVMEDATLTVWRFHLDFIIKDPKAMALGYNVKPFSNTMAIGVEVRDALRNVRTVSEPRNAHPPTPPPGNAKLSKSDLSKLNLQQLKDKATEMNLTTDEFNTKDAVIEIILNNQ